MTDADHPYGGVWWPPGHSIGWEASLVHELGHFLGAVAGRRSAGPLGATFEDGYRCAVVCDAILEAARTGRRVVVGSMRPGHEHLRPRRRRGAALTLAASRGAMRITGIRTRQVDVELPAPFHPAWAPGATETRIRLCYLRIDTDAGLHGIAGHEFFGAEEQAVRAHRHVPRRRGSAPDREARRHAPVPLALLRHRRLVRRARALGHPRQGRRACRSTSCSAERARRGAGLRVDRPEPDAGPAGRRLSPAPGRGVPRGEASHPQRHPRRGPGAGEGGPKGRRRRHGDHGRRQPGRRQRRARCPGRTGPTTGRSRPPRPWPSTASPGSRSRCRGTTTRICAG